MKPLQMFLPMAASMSLMAPAVCAETLQLETGITIEHDDDASVRVLPHTIELMLEPGKRTPSRVILLSRGTARVTVSPSARRVVFVKLPRGLAAIARSGELVAAAGEQFAAASNVSGSHWTGEDSRFRPLDPGMRHVVETERHAREPVLPAPKLRAAKTLLRAGPGAAQGLRVEPLAGAASYQLARRCGDEQGVFAFAGPAVPPVSLAPGVCRVSARAVDRYGLPGAMSAPVTLRAVGVQAPAGGFVDGNGVVRVAPGQEASLLGASGLELSRGRDAPWLPASVVSREEDGRETVFLRVPGTSGPVLPIRLADRGFDVTVRVGPKYAVWPKHPVKISIDLNGTDGRPLPEWVQAEPKVWLGVEPLTLKWHRTGHRLRATVRPRDDGGPWVVRVEVRDQWGYVLGRDHVEVVER